MNIRIARIIQEMSIAGDIMLQQPTIENNTKRKGLKHSKLIKNSHEYITY